MKAALLACVFLGLTASAFAQEYSEVAQDEARFLYFNSTSTATSLTLLGALILLGVIGYLVYVGGLLGTNNRNDYQYDPYYGQEQAYTQAQYR